MKHLNKPIVIVLSLTALLMTSEVMAAGSNSSKKSEASESSQAGLQKSKESNQKPESGSGEEECKKGKKEGVLCADGSCDTSPKPKNLFNGHGGAASPN